MQHSSSWFIVLLVLLLSACGAKNSANTPSADSTKQSSYTPPADDRDSPRKRNTSIDHQGKHYEISITSVPDESLPKAKDSYGDDYLDNRFQVLIDCEGHRLLAHSFTKADFLPHLNHNNPLQLILGGIAYKEIKAKELILGAQLNVPGSEEGGIAFLITLPLSEGATPRITLDTAPDVDAAQGEEAMD